MPQKKLIFTPLILLTNQTTSVDLPSLARGLQTMGKGRGKQQ
jgi:hypothetical protein